MVLEGQQEVAPENKVFELTQGPAAHHLEIADIILVQAGENHPAILSAARHQADLAHKFLFRNAMPESRVAGAENSA